MSPVDGSGRAPGGPPGSGPDSGEVEAGPNAGSSSSATLTALSLKKSYRKYPVLQDVSVRIASGESVALLGSNGAGKTTCFNILTGLVQPESGRVWLNGRDVTDMPLYRRARFGLGYLPQEASIFRGLNVEMNIRAVLQLSRLPPQEQDARLEQLLEEFSIGHIRRSAASSLSGGERRRVEIARALAGSPRFILLDEPLAGIDPIAVGDIRNLIAHLKETGVGVLITDHNVRETLGIVDRAYILNQGVILHEGRPTEIVAHPDVRSAYLGEDFELPPIKVNPNVP